MKRDQQLLELHLLGRHKNQCHNVDAAWHMLVMLVHQNQLTIFVVVLWQHDKSSMICKLIQCLNSCLASNTMVLIIYEPFCNADDEYLSVPKELDDAEHVLEPRHEVLPFQKWVKLTNHLDS